MLLIEDSGAYLADEANVDATIRDLPYAVVDETGSVSTLVAMFANRHEAEQFISRRNGHD